MQSPTDPTEMKGPGHVEDHDDTKTTHAATKHRTAGLLSFLSLILLADAIYRIIVVAGTPTGHWDQEGTNFAPIVPLLAGICELLFSSLGLLVGLGWMLFDFESKPLTMALLGIQVVLGSFTYFVFTLAYPAYRINKAPFHPHSRTAAAVFGWILTAMAYSGILQAGQFLLTLQFLRLQSGVSRLGSGYFRPRCLLLAALIFLSGLSKFICGIIVRHQDNEDLFSRRANPVGPNAFMGANPGKIQHMGAFYPGLTPHRGFPIFGDFNAVRWPAITIVSGVLEMIFGLLTMAAAFASGLFVACAAFGVLLWCWLISAHILAMYGLISSTLTMQAVLTALISTALIVVPLYYAKEAHRVKDT